MDDITPEKILSHIRIGSNSVAEHFDRIYGHTVDVFGVEIAHGLSALRDNLFNNLHNIDLLSEADYQSASAFWSSINTLIAAMDLMRRGYWKEPGALHRNALEMASAAYDLHANPSKLESFLKGTFDSKKSITVAKKVRPEIGVMYGIFSDVFAHTNVANSQPQRTSGMDGIKFWIGGGFKESDIKTHMTVIPSMGLTILIVNMLAEISFQGLMPSRLWEKDGEFLRLKIPSEMQEELKKYTPLLEEIFNEKIDSLK